MSTDDWKWKNRKAIGYSIQSKAVNNSVKKKKAHLLFLIDKWAYFLPVCWHF